MTPAPTHTLRRIDLAEVEYADDDAHGGGDIADLAEVSWAAHLLEAEEHEEHHGGDHELQGDQFGDAGESMQIKGSRLGIDRKGQEGHGGEIGVGGKLPGAGAKGPGHGAVDISRAEKNRDQQGQQNPRRGAAAEIRVARENDDPGAGEAHDNSENADQVWRAHAEKQRRAAPSPPARGRT